MNLNSVVYEDEDIEVGCNHKQISDAESSNTSKISAVLAPVVNKRKKRRNRIEPPHQEIDDSELVGNDNTSDDMQFDETHAVELDRLNMILLTPSGQQQFRKYMLIKVANGVRRNPFCPNPFELPRLKKYVRRLTKFCIVKACENQGMSDIEYPSNIVDACSVIYNFNEGIINSIIRMSSFTTEMVRCARSNCKKFWVQKKNAVNLVADAQHDATCMISECRDTSVAYYCLLDGLYNDKLELQPNDNQDEPSNMQVLCLCTSHIGMYDFMFMLIHMKWNIYMNCRDVVGDIVKREPAINFSTLFDSVPKEVYSEIGNHFLCYYNLIWAFGDPKGRKKFDLFEKYSLKTTRGDEGKE